MSEWDKPEKGFKKFESATIQMFFDKWKSALCKVALLIQWVQEMAFPEKLQPEEIFIITQGWNSLWLGSAVQGGKNGGY